MLRLNDYNVYRNATAGVHDPSMLYDPVTKRYYSYCTDVYGPLIGLEEMIGIPLRSSPDMLHFRYEGTVLSQAAVAEAQDNGAFPPTLSFWAPYAEYVRGEYRLYYSATKAFGSSESRIWLATAASPLGPFENRGVVADTWGTDDTLPNAIDPHVIWAGERCYLVYGSFFGGIYLKELSPETGLPLDGDSRSLGRCLSHKGDWPGPDGPEGAAVCYVPETGYFYLFQSYGWLGETYDIRVGRSKTAEGPYLDRRGRSLLYASPGEKLAGSYCFEAAAPLIGQDEPDWRWDGFRAPGHGVPFYDPRREHWFFVHHIRDGAAVNRFQERGDGRTSYRRHYGFIRPMFFRDGWPVLGPEPFAGEELRPLHVTGEAEWELIFLTGEGEDCKRSVRRRLSPDDPLLTRGTVYACRDYENSARSLALTGIDKLGIAYWGKLVYNTSVIDYSKILEKVDGNMLHIKNLDEGAELFKALGSELRIQILKLLLERKEMNMNEIASALGVTNGALTSHIKKLSEAGLVSVLTERSGHGNQKLCRIAVDKLLVDIQGESAEDEKNIVETELPIGLYSEYSVFPTCGLASTRKLVGVVDDPRCFAYPERVQAGILWFTRGYIEYNLPNLLPSGTQVDQLTLSVELGSEAPGVNSDWPSDIAFYLNDVRLGVWTSPGDFGDIRGIFTPGWWFPNWNQYGLLKMLVINKKGTHIDGLKISDVSIDRFGLDYKSVIRFRFQVEETAGRAGGLTLFGTGFGNYNQDIKLRMRYRTGAPASE